MIISAKIPGLKSGYNNGGMHGKAMVYAKILLILSVFSVFPRVGLAKTVEVNTGARISAVLSASDTRCNETRVLQQFDLEYQQGTKAFFQKVDPKTAYPVFVRAIGLWKSSKCSFVATNRIEKVARCFVLATRSLLLMHRSKDAKDMAMQGIKQLGSSIFHARVLPPDVAPLFNAREKRANYVVLKVRTFKKNDDCSLFVDGIGFNDHIGLAPGKHVLIAKCGKGIKWVEDLDIRANKTIKLAPGLTKMIKGIKKDMAEIDFADVDGFLTRMAFCTDRRYFSVLQAGITTQWTSENGHWGPERARNLAVKNVTTPHSRSKLRVLPIVLASAAVLVAGMGGTFNFLANRATGQINSGINKIGIRKNYTIAAWTSYGTAAGLAITAAVLWIVRGTRKPINVAITPQGAAFSLSF